MPRYVVEEHKETPPVDQDTIFPAKIVSVTEIERDIKGEKTKKLAWKVKVSAPGTDWDGRHYTGEVFARLTEHPDNQFRLWLESLLGHPLPAGYEINTDDFEGMQCRVAIGYREYVKDGKDRWANFVSDILPAH
jgi:hypothetical protein